MYDLVWDPAANGDFPFHDPTYVGYRRQNQFQCPGVDPRLTTQTQPTEEINEQTNAPAREYNMLHFWTLSVFFRIKMVDSVVGVALIWNSLHDKPCGRLTLDGLDDSQVHDSDGTFEIILLSSMSLASLHPTDAMERVRGSGLDPDSLAYNVMIIEWMGDVAERRGIGFISEESVANSCAPGPVWKEIVLG